MELNKEKLQTIRQDLNKALNAAQIQGLQIELGNCRYDAAQATFKLVVTVEGATTRAEREFKMMAGLQRLDTNKIATLQHMQCKLTGYNSRARKMPWIVTDQKTGSEYKLTDRQAEIHFAA